MQTLATLKKMGEDGKFEHLYDAEPAVVPLPVAHGSSKSATIYERFKPYLVAASVIIVGVVILFNLMTSVQQPQNSGPISMIEYEIERSADNQTMLDNYLQEAVSFATSGNLEAAYAQIDEASSLELTSEQDIDLKMVKGAIQYNSQDYSEALQTFQSINEIEGIGLMNLEKGTWYLANTQLQLGMTDEAIESMERVIELDGSFSRVAKNKLGSIRQPAS
jgi:tetratricopeptide (TPR) repeat protein